MRQTFLYIPKPFLITSFVLHILTAFFFILIAFVDIPLIPIGKKRDAHPMHKLYQASVQVDLVSLPDTTLEDKFVDPTSKIGKKIPKVKVEKEDVMVIPTKKKPKAKPKKKDTKKKRLTKQQDALARLQRQAKREKAMREVMKGNVLSKGTAALGKVGTDKDQYNALLKQKITEHFNVYAWQKRKKLVTIVQIEINNKGEVTNKEIVKKSGDKLYDKAALLAIDQAQPFPVPEDLSIIKDGISIEFTPQDE